MSKWSGAYPLKNISFNYQPSDLRFTWLARLEDFDPFRHEFPMALEKITQGELVTLVIGDETFTVEPSQSSLYTDGVAYRSAAVGQHIPVMVSSPPPIKVSMFLVMLKDIE